MSWNYHVRKVKCPDGSDWHEIVEAYYREDNETIQRTTVDGMKPGGETIEELRSDLQYMLQALDHPVID